MDYRGRPMEDMVTRGGYGGLITVDTSIGDSGPKRGGVSMNHKPRRTFDAAFKLQVVQMIRDQGMSVLQGWRSMMLSGPEGPASASR